MTAPFRRSRFLGTASSGPEASEPWVETVADRLVGIEALVNDLLDDRAGAVPTWELIDEEMAEVRRLLDHAPPAYAHVVRLARRYRPEGWPRRKRRALRRLGVAFFEVSGYGLYLRLREQNAHQQTRRRRRADEPRALDVERAVELRRRVRERADLLAGAVLSLEPDWSLVRDLARLIDADAAELAEG